ncbi:helix-turn-helix transcriptional regulator [Acinetobacter bereziniae]|uniref:helix-turn-helix domain-containing protein n=1 Tax=Acinetobacter bereziniae TaxID=106648 RepID=UPI00300B670C
MSFAPKMGACYHAPKIGAMKTLKLSIHSPEQIWLRQLLINRRGELGLTQRTLAERLDVVYSFVGKVETGERRLDVFEFISYCVALDLDSLEVMRQIEKNFYEE